MQGVSINFDFAYLRKVEQIPGLANSIAMNKSIEAIGLDAISFSTQTIWLHHFYLDTLYMFIIGMFSSLEQNSPISTSRNKWSSTMSYLYSWIIPHKAYDILSQIMSRSGRQTKKIQLIRYSVEETISICWSLTVKFKVFLLAIFNQWFDYIVDRSLLSYPLLNGVLDGLQKVSRLLKRFPLEKERVNLESFAWKSFPV